MIKWQSIKRTYERGKLVPLQHNPLHFQQRKSFAVRLCDKYSCGLAQMNRLMTKPTKWPLRPAKTQISMGIHLVWSESSLSAWRNIGSSATHWAHYKDSDQTGQMPRLIWVCWAHSHFVGFCHEAAEITYLGIDHGTLKKNLLIRSCVDSLLCGQTPETEISHDMTKPTKWLCVQRRLRSAWASAQSDHSLRCPHEESLGP